MDELAKYLDDEMLPFYLSLEVHKGIDTIYVMIIVPDKKITGSSVQHSKYIVSFRDSMSIGNLPRVILDTEL